METLSGRSFYALFIVLGLWLSGCDSSSSSDARMSDTPASAPTTPAEPPASTPSVLTGHAVTGALPAIGEVMIAVNGASVSRTVSATGSYSIPDLPDGTYTLTPSAVNADFEPKSVTVELRGSDVTVQNFKVEVDNLDEQTLAALTLVPDTRLPDNAVTLPNGYNLYGWLRRYGIRIDPVTGVLGDTRPRAFALPATDDPEQRRQHVIAALIAYARGLACGHAPTNRCVTWDFPAEPSDPASSPAQSGLVYLWGVKTVTSRQSPTQGRCTAQKMFGLDCSGFVSSAAASTGITAQGNSTGLRNADNWKLPESWGLEMKLVTDGTQQTGDIIGFNGHIGILASPESKLPSGTPGLNLLHSIGRPDLCEGNLGPTRGPIEQSLEEVIKGRTEESGKDPVAILRLAVKTQEACDPACGFNQSCRRSQSCPPGSTCPGVCSLTDVSVCENAAKCPGGYSCSMENSPYHEGPRQLPRRSWTGAADECPNGACFVCPAGYKALGLCFPG